MSAFRQPHGQHWRQLLPVDSRSSVPFSCRYILQVTVIDEPCGPTHVLNEECTILASQLTGLHSWSEAERGPLLQHFVSPSRLCFLCRPSRCMWHCSRARDPRGEMWVLVISCQANSCSSRAWHFDNTWHEFSARDNPVIQKLSTSKDRGLCVTWRHNGIIMSYHIHNLRSMTWSY